jgi:predicted ATP-grasp superfamily ATP-dependent carboligase
MQRWIAGRSYGASFLSDGISTCLLGVCRSAFSRINGLPFVYAGSVGPVTLSEATADSLRQLGRLLADHGVCGIFNADFVVDRSGVSWLLEINPRWSGSSEILERSMRHRGQLAQGNSLMGLAYQALQDASHSTGDRSETLKNWIAKSEQAESASPITKTMLKRVVFARRDFRLDRNRLEKAMSELDNDRLEVVLSDLPPHGRQIRKGEPILSLIASFDTVTTPGPHRIGHLVRHYCTAVQQSSL